MYNIDPSKVVEGVDSLSKASIELAAAASDLGALKVFFGVGMVITLIIAFCIILTIYNINNRIMKIARMSDKVESYFTNLSNRTIGKEEGKSIVREALDKSSSLSKYYILRIRWENHIENNPNATKEKISGIIDNNFSELNSLLSRFICVDKPLSSMMVDNQDIETLKSLMTNNVFQKADNFKPSNMDQELEIFYKGVKIRTLQKIDEI